MIQLQTGNIFKNEFINFKKYFKMLKSQKIYLNQISFDFKFNQSDVEQYNLKYFKVIAINKFENIFYQNNDTINNDKSGNFISINNLKKDIYHPLFSQSKIAKKSIINLQKNIFNIGKNKNLEIETHTNLKKREIQKSIENIINFNKKNIIDNNLTFIINLSKVNSINDLEKSIYNFYIYAYDINDNIIDKISIVDQNIYQYTEQELFKNNLIEEIDDIKFDFLNDFYIDFDSYDDNFERKRSINFKFGNNLYKTLVSYDKNQKKLINKIIISEYSNDLLLQTIDINKDFNSLSQFIFNTPILINNNTILKYLVTVEYVNKKIINKDLNYDISKIFLKNKKKDEVISDNNLFLNVFKNIEVFYLQKEKLLQINLHFNDLKIDKYFDPIFTSISFNNKELIDFCYIDKEKIKKLNLSSKRLLDFFQNESKLIFYINVQGYKFNIINDQILKINIQKKFNNKDSFSFQNKITIINNNIIQNVNKVYANLIYTNEKEILLNSEYTGLDLNYNLDISNLNKNIDYFATKNKSLEKYLKTNYSQIISETKKADLEKNISLNQFYIIVKKNVLLDNNKKNEYYFISPINLDESNNFLFNLTDYNIMQFKEIYSQLISYKEVYFESKILVVPSDLYEINEYQSKNKIKSIILENKIDQKVIIGDDIISNVFMILKKNNLNNISSLNDFDIEYLYNYYTLDYSYAKSNNKKVQYQKQIIQAKKNILINNEIINIKLLKDKIEFDLDLNIEEINRLNISKEIILTSFNKIFKKNKIFSFFYFKNDKNSFNEIYKILFEKNEKCYYNNKIYLDLINEINNYVNINYQFKSKNILNISFEINFNNTPMLRNFLKYCKNINNNLNLLNKMNLENNLYQVLSLPNVNIQYLDTNNNNIQIESLFSNKEIYIKYFDLSLI